MTNYVIYRMYCNGTLLCYIGSTSNLKRRKIEHKTSCYNVNDGSKYNYKHYKYIRDSW